MRWMWALVALAAACDGADVTDNGPVCEVTSYGFDSYTGAIDLLFVVDATADMDAHRDGVAFNFPRFANVIENIEGGMPSIHVGGVAADGSTLRTLLGGDCSGTDGRFLVDVREPWFACSDQPGASCRLRNYDGAFDEAILCTVPEQGVGGWREPLATALRVLDPTSGSNAGFDRRDTPLQIVIIAAGDDESPMPVKQYADAIHALSDDRIGPLVSVVAPADSPRLRSFADEFPQRNIYVDIAEEDWTEALVPLAELFKRTLGFPCLTGADMTDLDPDTPGLQPNCSVTAHDGEVVIPACEMITADRPHPETALPCWWIRDWGDTNGAECRYNVQVEHDGFPTAGFADVSCAGFCE